MANESGDSSEQTMGELRDVSLRLPGEHFFCETIDLPKGAQQEDLYEIAQVVLSEERFSPYPVDQLAWGFHSSLEESRMFIFASPMAKLKQLGWQNLEIFRHVFPSFVSLLGRTYAKPTVAFLLHEETLTAAAFESESRVPALLFSMPIDSEDEESMERTRGKLLSLMDLEKFDVESDVLVSDDLEQTKDGSFQFEHHWLDGDDPKMEINPASSLSEDELWGIDLRQVAFKFQEKRRRRQANVRWKVIMGSTIGMAAMLVAFIGIKIMGIKLEEKRLVAENMAMEVPLVIESQKMLEKLRQNKLGGIDPFGAIGRLAQHRGGSGDQPDLWFSMAHFESRVEVKLEGEGKSVPSVNNFIEKLKQNKVAEILGEKIKSGGGKTTFDIELELTELDGNAESKEANDNQDGSKES